MRHHKIVELDRHLGWSFDFTIPCHIHEQQRPQTLGMKFKEMKFVQDDCDGVNRPNFLWTDRNWVTGFGREIPSSLNQPKD